MCRIDINNVLIDHSMSYYLGIASILNPENILNDIKFCSNEHTLII